MTMGPIVMINHLVTKIREAKEQQEVLNAEVIQPARERLLEILPQVGGGWEDGTGYARLTADSTRVSYDAKALDALIAADPERYGFLSAFRKEVIVQGSLQVK